MNQFLTPGPVFVPPFVLEAINKDVIHHRSPKFQVFYKGLLERLSYLFQAKTVGTMMGSGTFGVASMMYSLFQSGEKVVVVNNGKFSARWVDEGRLQGLEVIELQKKWGEGVSTPEVLDQLDTNVAGVILTHSETSTGVIVDVENIAFAIKRAFPGVLIVVDAITSVGVMPYYHDAWQIDGSIVSAQKALMNPAGTVAFALSDLAVGKLKPSHSGDFRNLYNYIQSNKEFTHPFTAPAQLLYGLDVALASIQGQELPAIWDKSHQSARTFRLGLEKLGGKIYAQPASEALTAFSFENWDMEKIKSRLKSEYGWTLSSGQGKLKGNILRVSHMGTSDRHTMEALLKDMEKMIKP
ncbi:MAG: aminotransferase class V-fold PLP-dependent enzyme [Bacteroidota bacterium]